LADTTAAGGDRYELYDITTAIYRPVPIDRTLDAIDCPDLTVCTTIDAVGSDWMVTQEACSEHCGTVGFQDLATGAVQTDDPSAATAALDLNSPTLTRPLCAGVQAPMEGVLSGEGAPPLPRGLVAADGRFQIVSDYDVSYLQECGTHLKRFLTYACELYPCAPPFNSRAVVWESHPGRLTGVLLPSLTRFQIRIPVTIDPTAPSARFVSDDTYGLALTPRRLYLSTSRGVFSAPARRRPLSTSPPVQVCARCFGARVCTLWGACWGAWAAARSETARPPKLVAARTATTVQTVAVEAMRWTSPSTASRRTSRVGERRSYAMRSSTSATISGP
jgi:hypothetical protein